MWKVKLNERLDSEVFDRLMRLKSSQKISVSDLIANALDALEREQKLPEMVAERMEKQEGKLSFLVDVVTELGLKMDQASVNEKERLKSLLQLLKVEMQTHDEAEQKRFDRMSSAKIFS